MSFLSYLFASIAVIGGVLNARNNLRGFYLWILSNVYFAIEGLVFERYYQVILFGVYFFITIYGIMQWKKTMK